MLKIGRVYYDYYYGSFNTPCVSHEDDESQARETNRAHFHADKVNTGDCYAWTLFACSPVASRAKMMAVKSISKLRGQTNHTLYPQPEGMLGECMAKYGKEMGEDSLYGMLHTVISNYWSSASVVNQPTLLPDSQVSISLVIHGL